jgi:hypothetical protein
MRLFTILFSTLLLSSNIMAAVPTVKITSFIYNGPDRKGAELCGAVTDQVTMPTFVQVIVDHTTSSPANYNTLVGSDGKFCIAVVTLRGTAIVKIIE